MEQYDQLMKELNVQKLIDRINALGYNSTSNNLLTVSKCLSENLNMLTQFTQQSDDQSLLHFLAEYTFQKQQSKKITGIYCFQLIFSLQTLSIESIELLTILFLYCVDYSQDLTRFYLYTRNSILQYFTLHKNSLLDHIQVKLDDWVNISTKLFSNQPPHSVITMVTNLISNDMATKQQFDPYRMQTHLFISLSISITASRLQQVCLKIYLDQRQIPQEPHQSHQKQSQSLYQEEKQNRQAQTATLLSGFYRWESPLFKRKEFLENPTNIEMLENLRTYRQKYPIMRFSTPKKEVKKVKEQKSSPKKEQPKENQAERQLLKRELARQTKEKLSYQLKFNLLMDYYKNIKKDHLHIIQQLENMYIQYDKAQKKWSESIENPEEYAQNKEKLQKLKQDIDIYERELRKEGILPPTIMDEFQAASKAQFKEPQRKYKLNNQEQSEIQNKQKILDSGCIFREQVPQSDLVAINIVHKYKVIYFDPTITIFPLPLTEDITYQQILDLFNDLIYSNQHPVKQFQSVSYFSSYDNRYLTLARNEQLECISKLDGWLVGRNQGGQIGCFSPTYVIK